MLLQQVALGFGLEVCFGLKTLEVDVLEDLSIFGGLDYEALHLEVTLEG